MIFAYTSYVENILEVKNLSVRLEGETLIHDINFALASGESVGIIGPNGAGKTLLLRSLLGLVPHEGEIVWAPNVHVGYVPQKVDIDRHTPLNGMDLMVAKCHVQKIAEKEIGGAMENANVPNEVAQIPMGHLSGGQFQKVLIALALLGNPQVLFFDEPTANLDEPSEEHIYELIHKLEDKKISVCIVSHDLEAVRNSVAKVLCVNVQQICYGAPDEVLTSEVFGRLYGTPHTRYHRLSEKNMTH